MLNELEIELEDLKRQEELHFHDYSLAELCKLRARIRFLEKQLVKPVATCDDICLSYNPSSKVEKYIGEYEILLADTRDKVGEVTLDSIGEYGLWKHNIGYFVDEEYRNHGYCTKGVLALLKYLASKKCPFVQINIDEHNASSLNVAKKLEKDFKIYKTKFRGINRHLVVLDEKAFSDYLKNIHKKPQGHAEDELPYDLDLIGISTMHLDTVHYADGLNYFVQPI